MLVGRVEVGEQVEDFVDDLDVALFRLVDLVDAHDGAQADLQRLGDHELGLRHRAFGRVDKNDRAVDHVEDALYLAAEVGVAGRVDDVDADVVPDDRGGFRQDRDAALTFEVVRIHHPFGRGFVVAERA